MRSHSNTRALAHHVAASYEQAQRKDDSSKAVLCFVRNSSGSEHKKESDRYSPWSICRGQVRHLGVVPDPLHRRDREITARHRKASDAERGYVLRVHQCAFFPFHFGLKMKQTSAQNEISSIP